MLSDSLYCKGLLVHMYFLDEQCVLIFKTDNNKMLYLTIVSFELISAVLFCVFGTLWNKPELYCHTSLSKCTHGRDPYSGTNPETAQTY